jgi:hypothetical protein
MPLSSYAVYGHGRLARYERATPSPAGKKLGSLPTVPCDEPTTNRSCRTPLRLLKQVRSLPCGLIAVLSADPTPPHRPDRHC